MTRLRSQSSVVQEALGKPFRGRARLSWRMLYQRCNNMLGNKTRVPRQPYLSFPPHGVSSLVKKVLIGMVQVQYVGLLISQQYLYSSIGNELLVVFSVCARWPIVLKGVVLQTMWRTAAPKGSPCPCPLPPCFPLHRARLCNFWEFENSLHWLSHLVCVLLIFETYTILSNPKVSEG